MSRKGFGLISVLLIIGIILVISMSIYFWISSTTLTFNSRGSNQEKKSIPEVLNETKKEFGGETSIVSEVIDGDTIKIMDNQEVRYIGIDTPEISDSSDSSECFGGEAAAKNKELVEGKRVNLEKDVSNTDKYGRLLRYVWVGDIFVNDYLVRQGYAKIFNLPPDVKYSEQLSEAQREAKENNRGLWANCK